MIRRFILIAVAIGMPCPQIVRSQEVSAVDRAAYSRAVDNAVRYLRAKGQADDGSFTAVAGPGITAIVATGLLRNGISADDPLVADSLKYLRGFVRDDGAICSEGSLYSNYETSMTVMCFSEAEKQKPGKYKQLLAAAERYLKGIQYDESEGEDRSSTNYGGGGYGHEKRPDLSNTGMLVDALKSLGRGPEDEAIQKALIFVSRCQNLETEHNDTKWASKNPDGSFYYTCADGGSSPAKWPEGVSEEVRGLRGYGAMTYVGLKSLIYAGVSKDDPRVKAATRWIQKNYSLDVNPGLGQNGLYYYFQTFGKAFDAIGEDAVVDAKGVKHNWRAELVQKLASLQNEDGSWINESPRWFEGDPNLATGHALLALSHCRPRKKAATSVIEK